MKTKRSLVLILILLLVSVLGVGYALSTKELTIKGSATVTATDDNFIVRFKKTGDSIYESPSAMTNATGTITNDTEATITVNGLSKVNDEATITYTVENASNGLDAMVLANITNSNETYFDVSVTGISTSADSKTKIASGDTAQITVNVKLLKTPIIDQSANVTIKLTADAVTQD